MDTPINYYYYCYCCCYYYYYYYHYYYSYECSKEDRYIGHEKYIPDLNLFLHLSYLSVDFFFVWLFQYVRMLVIDGFTCAFHGVIVDILTGNQLKDILFKRLTKLSSIYQCNFVLFVDDYLDILAVVCI